MFCYDLFDMYTPVLIKIGIILLMFNILWNSTIFTCIVQSLYNTYHYNTDLDISQYCCGSIISLPLNFTKLLLENDSIVKLFCYNMIHL